MKNEWDACVSDAVVEVIKEIGGAVFYMAFAFFPIHESGFFVDYVDDFSWYTKVFHKLYN